MRGPYRYFDTQAVAGGGYTDVSGWGGIFTASTTIYTKSPWFARFVVNHIYVPKNLDTNTYVLGVGYHLWEEQPEEPVKPGEAPKSDEPERTITGDEITLFVGQTVVNSYQDQKGFAGGIEFRKGIAEHIDWSLAWLNAGDVQVNRRNGLGMQLWLVNEYFDGRLPIGIGAGPVYFLDRRKIPVEGRGYNGDLAGLASLTAAYRFSEHWFARFHLGSGVHLEQLRRRPVPRRNRVPLSGVAQRFPPARGPLFGGGAIPKRDHAAGFPLFLPKE